MKKAAKPINTTSKATGRKLNNHLTHFLAPLQGFVGWGDSRC
jgi:hypothetical protein